MSPEQVRCSPDVDHRADLWALGVIAFFCLTGGRPFSATAISEVLAQICEAPPLAPSHLVPDLGQDVDGFFERALARDPGQRFQSAQAFAEAFAELAGGGAARSIASQRLAAAPGAEKAWPALATGATNEPVMLAVSERSASASSEPPLSGPRGTRIMPGTQALGPRGTVRMTGGMALSSRPSSVQPAPGDEGRTLLSAGHGAKAAGSAAPSPLRSGAPGLLLGALVMVAAAVTYQLLTRLPARGAGGPEAQAAKLDVVPREAGGMAPVAPVVSDAAPPEPWGVPRAVSAAPPPARLTAPGSRP
jgi:serine/threonine-protein kinase